MSDWVELFINPDADLVADKAQNGGPYEYYVCGCYSYRGDLDAPHDTPCPQHAMRECPDCGYDDEGCKTCDDEGMIPHSGEES